MIRVCARGTFVILALAGGLMLSACGGDSPSTDGKSSLPTGAVAMEAWLKTGAYKQWKCEAAVHPSRDPSPHGFNRICSNAQISDHVAGTAPWPVGSAAVKELFASADGASPIGYAVYSKTKSDSAGGASWYWYERVPLDSSAPHDVAGVVADGMGSSGPPLQVCVSCHGAAGADPAHTPSPGGRDQVYTPVN